MNRRKSQLKAGAISKFRKLVVDNDSVGKLSTSQGLSGNSIVIEIL